MKKLLLALCMVAIMVVNVHAGPKTYILYLGATDSGNTTTNVSGVSTLIIEGPQHQRSQGITDLIGLEHYDVGDAIMQVEVLTISQASQQSVASNSGATFTIRYRERVSSGVTWSLTNPVTIFDGVALSGNSLYQTVFYPEAMGQIRFEFISGATEFDNAKIKFRILD